MITGNLLLTFGTFGLVSAVILLIWMFMGSRKSPVEARLADVGGSQDRSTPSSSSKKTPVSVVTKIGATLMPKDESKAGRLVSRMQQAGLYRRHSSMVFLGIKFFLMVTPVLAGLVLSAVGLLPLHHAVLIGVVVGLLGNLASGIWLGHLKGKRQTCIRRALPDALDVIVVCMEGGLSLPASFERVSKELRGAHPLLADEMAIVQREIQLGRSTGEALRQFADRFDVDELRSMASVVVQAERFGASVVKAMRVHAETLRMKRYQHAEEQAQKAPVKLIFPTVLCIFPALYVVLMGPAGVQLLEMLDNMPD